MSTHTLSQLLPAGGGGSDYLFSRLSFLLQTQGLGVKVPHNRGVTMVRFDGGTIFRGRR
jgi:hypothetical protein